MDAREKGLRAKITDDTNVYVRDTKNPMMNTAHDDQSHEHHHEGEDS